MEKPDRASGSGDNVLAVAIQGFKLEVVNSQKSKVKSQEPAVAIFAAGLSFIFTSN